MNWILADEHLARQQSGRWDEGVQKSEKGGLRYNDVGIWGSMTDNAKCFSVVWIVGIYIYFSNNLLNVMKKGARQDLK